MDARLTGKPSLVTALLLLAVPLGSAAAQGIDHEHKAWTRS